MILPSAAQDSPNSRDRQQLPLQMMKLGGGFFFLRTFKEFSSALQVETTCKSHRRAEVHVASTQAEEKVKLRQTTESDRTS